MDNSRGVFSKHPPDQTEWRKIFISWWHFLSRSFCLCKHEAEKPGFSRALTHARTPTHALEYELFRVYLSM